MDLIRFSRQLGCVVVQIIGFAAGGLCAYGYLVEQPYCEKCSRHLSPKRKARRYTGNPETLKANAIAIGAHVREGAIPRAIVVLKAFCATSFEKRQITS
jgi:hypothetical protein